MKYSFAVRKFSKLFLITLLFTLLGTNLFGQKKSAPGTVASISDKNKATVEARPRVVAKAEAQVEKTDNSTISSASAPLYAKLERQVFDLLNQKRTENNLSPLVWSDDMAKIARQHSENMATLKFFSHTGKDGLMVHDRADALGISNWRAIGENIAYNRGYDKPAEFAIERWMLSPAHRDNILSKMWKEAGIGAAIADDGAYYFTQVFVER